MEFVKPEVAARILARAKKKKCECENIRCKHVAGYCPNPLENKSRITLPKGAVTEQDQFEKGRAVCQQCFPRSDSFHRQQPLVA